MSQKTIWILTEERPKKKVISELIKRIFKELEIEFYFLENIIITPIVEDGKFLFRYLVRGWHTPLIANVYIEVISGTSSFVDYLVYESIDRPSPQDIPLLVIEETKTSDGESRNTGVYQRATKFIYLEKYYGSDISKIMLYNGVNSDDEGRRPSDTNIFGTRCLLTLGVEFIGKELTEEFRPWTSLDEFIEAKGAMRAAPAGNIPLTIRVDEGVLKLTGRLVKSGRLGHDPNIGALTLFAATARKLGWDSAIEISDHGLAQSMLTDRNKFVRIAQLYSIQLEGLELPSANYPSDYWRYDTSGEKIGTIFLHLLVNAFIKENEGFSIYENHAGSERGYFSVKTFDDDSLEHLAVEKYYTNSNSKKEVIRLPDLVLLDVTNSEILNIEGEKFCNALNGVAQLNGFELFERLYVKQYYSSYNIIRTVVLYGSSNEVRDSDAIDTTYQGVVSLFLNDNGDIILSVTAPRLFCLAVNRLFKYWGLPVT